MYGLFKGTRDTIGDGKRGEVAVDAQGVLLSRLSGASTPVNTVPTVSATTGAMLAANTSRVRAEFQNHSDTVIYLAFGKAAVANEGVRVAVGSAYELASQHGNLTTLAVNAITASGSSKVLSVTEWTVA